MRFGFLSLLGTSLFVFTSCAHHAAVHDDWDKHMPELGEIFSDFLPHLNSPEGLAAGLKTEPLEKDRSELHHLISKVDDHGEASTFDHELRATSQALHDGKLDESFHRLRLVNRLCFSCHAMMENAAPPFASELPERFEKMSFLQRGDFYLGTFRYSDAAYEYERGLLDPSWAQLNRREWNDHMERLLSVVVRDRDNPEFTADVLTRFYGTNAYPNELRRYLKQWQRHIGEWKTELRHKKSQHKTSLERADELLQQSAREAHLNGQGSVRLLALRAAGILQREMNGDRKIVQNPQFLYLYGSALAYLGDAEMGPLPEFFLSRCANAHDTHFSELCAKKLVYFK